MEREGIQILEKQHKFLREKLTHLNKTWKVCALRIKNELQEQRETRKQRPNNKETEIEDQTSEQQQSSDWTVEDLDWIAQITQAAKCIYDGIVKDTGTE